MTDFVALPLVAALVLLACAGPVLDRQSPRVATRFAAVLTASIALAAFPTLWVMGLSGVAHLGFRNPLIDWSHHLLPDHRPIGAIVGLASLAAAAAGSVRVARVLRDHRRLRCVDTAPLEIVPSGEVFAYTLPGPAGTIAVSEGLVESLSEVELGVVLAHERAHAHHRHDRYKLLALVARAIVPPVGSVTKRLDYYLERWADEDAVATTSVARPVVARTIAKVALASATPSVALGVADHGIAARTTALLDPAPPPRGVTWATTAAMVVATVWLALFQLHHSAKFALGLTI